MEKSEIKLTVELDADIVLDSILWAPTDGESKQALPAKAMFLAFREYDYKNSLRIDLRPKDMRLDAMKRFFYETLHTLADTFIRAAGDDPVAEAVVGDLRDYCER